MPGNRNLFSRSLALWLSLFFLSGCSNRSDNQQRADRSGTRETKNVLSVAAAANLRYVLEVLKEEYSRKHPEVEMKISYGSSGTLTQQILNGASFGLFLSADTDFPEEIEEKGHAAAPPVIYCYGKIALWSEVIDVTAGLGTVADASVKKIALANPNLAPYGKNSVQALQKAGIYEKVQSKIVWGENVSQAAQFVSSGNAELGFVALSILMAPELKNKGTYYVLSEAESSPIAQGAVVLKSESEQIASDFLQFLLSEKASKIWSQFGYQTPVKS